MKNTYRLGYATGYQSKAAILRNEEELSIGDSIKLLCELETRNAELLEAVKKAHEILLHEMDNGRTPSMLQGVGLGYFEDVICGVSRD